MPAFNRRKKRFTASNVMHMRPLRHNQPRSDDDELEAVRPRRRRGIYLLPNAFTTAALFAGFFAIVQAMNLNFETAAIAIFAAMVLDGMDGRIARITNTQSAFGEQYDSLSDMCSFGVAPALVMYEWILRDLGKWGWLAAFVYCAGAALRLARFNTNIGVVDKRFFQGMPSPAAAALIAGFVWLAIDNKLPVKELWMPWVAFGLTLYAGLSMVSNAPFYSGKALDVRYRVPFGVMVLVLVLFVVVSSDPPVALFGLFVGYAVSGYLLWGWRTVHGQAGSPRLPRETAPDADE
ncbi:CDP-diacylglycerol--serine O-phosphatidyltransferase [Ralstonia solanacearum]|uniref:CDP-diacylglycerol--serine O-phosphatidyltransferase n=1 Tax=Ralstonia solanacearum TaxID=305 RepID=UPI0001D958B0|nr:CDP-diacylglycerol--serine O-phosphatidyltransferase [Ralstonia solanacearum]ATJ86896.1 CDP-diacylglycerol--serine O-phosphatidyltransferase [Ralstonia solanacearum]OAI77015.1 CDP-diacylglycerol--serine O-phosphatidyltransferase [Ralstonia solanacearum]RCW13855.1 CDP-diacylglycerol--serine O-phosphatidyltransferase [Ralstonia solanacearum]CBJ42613.1 CDP-diacylglycerol--serine O-phosphatidyltransferase [Ralstonia solanacearum CFBP2957]